MERERRLTKPEMICAPSWALLFYGTLENQLNFPITLSHEQRESSDFLR